jgi:ABC-2 type transport system permease protein
MRLRIATLIRKEFIELRRSPQLLRLVLIAPIIQLTMLGYAATTDVKNVPVVVVDGDRSPRSRALVERFAASPYFDIVREEMHPAAVEAALATRDAWLAIVIPPGFGDAILRTVAQARAATLASDDTGSAAGVTAAAARAAGGAGGAGASSGSTGTTAASPAVVQVIADGTDANSSGVALAYVQGLVAEFNASLAEQEVLAGSVAAAAIDGRTRIWFNPDLVSRNFMVPGVLALLLMIITANLTSMAIVRERELGTLDQLNVTPLGRWELILGKLLPYGLVGFIDVLLVVAVAVLWFQVPFRGSFPLLLAASLVYLLCTLGLGLFVSTISSTQQQAMMTSTFFFLLPMIYLSGFIFPIENMPRVIQHVTLFIPLRYFLVIVRGIFLKGVGFDILWPQFAALGAWGVTVLALAALRSSKRG